MTTSPSRVSRADVVTRHCAHCKTICLRRCPHPSQTPRPSPRKNYAWSPVSATPLCPALTWFMSQLQSDLGRHTTDTSATQGPRTHTADTEYRRPPRPPLRVSQAFHDYHPLAAGTTNVGPTSITAPASIEAASDLAGAASTSMATSAEVKAISSRLTPSQHSRQSVVAYCPHGKVVPRPLCFAPQIERMPLASPRTEPLQPGHAGTPGPGF